MSDLLGAAAAGADAPDPPVYPVRWEADVVLSDGRPVHIRPIRPDDGERLVRFHESLSEQTVYYRFFAPYPHLSERDVRRFTNVDYVDRLALVATVGEELIGVGRYELLSPGTAELAFTVADTHQGRGLGSVLLEHLAAAARESGLSRFVADVLPDNRRMLATFAEAGYRPTQHVSDGVVSLAFDIEPTAESVAVRTAREHRAEARSIAGLLAPRSVAVAGAGRSPGGLGHAVLRRIVDGGFAGRVVAVNSRVEDGARIGGVPAYRRLDDVPGGADLVVVAVPAEEVLDVVTQAAQTGARGLVVVSGGFAETDDAGAARQAELVTLARGSGMRVVGPNALGLLNTAPEVRLNASLASRLPAPGRVGFFSQSGALGGPLLERAATRGIGISSFVSAGNRADVSGNDLMQYWEDDAATDVVLLYLESIGNPRKFTRIARRLARRKPVVAVRSVRSTQALPLGHRVRRTALPPEALDALFEQSGVIQTTTVGALLDVAVLLAHQPLPAGPRVAIVGNSDALGVLAAGALDSAGLAVSGTPVRLRGDADAAAFAGAMAAAIEDPASDAVLALHVPPVPLAHTEHADVILAAARRGTTPVLAVLVSSDADGATLTDGEVTVPVFGTVEEAVAALAAVTRYAQWRRTPETAAPEPEGMRVAEADELLGRLLAELGSADPAEREVRLRAGAGDDPLTALLDCYGIAVEPSVVVRTASEAVTAARRFGYPVALTATDPELARRVDGVGVRLDLYNDRAVRGAWRALSAELDPDQPVERHVQRMVARGVDARIATAEDPSFGPVVAFTVGGAVAQVLGERSYRIPPLTADDARALVTGSRAAPLLARVPPATVTALEELLVRVGRLAEESPALARLVLDPILLTAGGPVVLGAQARVRRPGTRTDSDARRLTR